jgi:hypothetical protein
MVKYEESAGFVKQGERHQSFKNSPWKNVVIIQPNGMHLGTIDISRRSFLFSCRIEEDTFPGIDVTGITAATAGKR